MEQKLNLGTLYDANKQIMIKQSPMSHPALAAAQRDIEDWFNREIDCYAMLLCNERRDYTIFHLYENQNPNPCAIAAKECLGCLSDRGKILSIDPIQDDKAWEIWIRIDNEAYCYHLFRYDEAVIEC